MQKHNTDQGIISREKAILCYIQALDQGDIEGVVAVLEAALSDPELDRLISEVNLAYHEEEQLTSDATDAQLVRDLLREHLPSAFDVDGLDDKPLSVGDVAARLQADHRVPPTDQEANRVLLNSSVPLPAWLSVQAVRRLITELGMTVSDRFLRVFRDTAIMLGMGHSHGQAQLAAAREERVHYNAVQKKHGQASQPPSTSVEPEEDE